MNTEVPQEEILQEEIAEESLSMDTPEKIEEEELPVEQIEVEELPVEQIEVENISEKEIDAKKISEEERKKKKILEEKRRVQRNRERTKARLKAEKRRQRIQFAKQVFFIAMLLVLVFVIHKNEEKFWVEQNYIVENSVNAAKLNLLKVQQEIRQEFVAQDEKIKSIEVPFKAWNQRNNKGTITIDLEDSEHNVLASVTKNAENLVQNKKSIKTPFVFNVPLTKGETYSFVIRPEGLESASGIFLYLTKSKGEIFKTLTVDGEETDTRIRMSFTMYHMAKESQRMMYLVILGGIIFLLIPFHKVNDYQKKKKHKHKLVVWISRLLFVASPMVAFYIVQRYCDYDLAQFGELCKDYRGHINIFFYVMLAWALYLIFNRTKYSAALLVGIASMLGLTNYFVWQFRGAPIMMADLSSIGTAGDVALHYSYELNHSSLWAITVTLVFISAILYLPNYKGLPWKRRVCILLLFTLPYSFFYRHYLHSDELKENGVKVSVWQPASNYASNGCLLSFFLSYTYYRVEKPKNYSPKRAGEILGKYTSDEAASDGNGVKPNVIAIMNEAYSDLKVLRDFKTTEDYMPFVHSLQENTVKGDMYVSILGGNTANTEFEFLTGYSNTFLPFRSIPYDIYLKDKFPSLTHNLKASGYVGNIAVHPGTRTAWSRDTAYQHLGFDEFYCAEDMGELTYIRNFVSDESDFDFLIKKYEESRKTSKDPFYEFSVTIQNHGGYKSSQGLIKTPIKFVDDPLSEAEDVLQYINLLKITDDAFKDLVEYFKNVDEPTVIVMFGDHQPGFNTEKTEMLMGKPSEELELEDVLKQYTVPYIIWANYDIQEENRNMSSNYLSSYLMKVIGGNLTAYQKYELDLMEKLPMITTNGYMGDDGVAHQLEEKSEYSDLIHDYQVVLYNNMFDVDHRVEEYYYLK